uniref:Uncharacterized protein n=1 Tax=Moniliophthora roreri TaxID=221103 RepID=A0A0W0FG14_MONRR
MFISRSRFLLDPTTPLEHVCPRYTSLASACLSLVEARNDEKPHEHVDNLSNTRRPILVVLSSVYCCSRLAMSRRSVKSPAAHHLTPYPLERHGTVIKRTRTFAHVMITSTFS